MKIIVTGGAGFIGGNYIHTMLKKYPEDEIICVDALTYAGNLETLDPIWSNKNFIFVKANISERETMYDLFEREKPDVVINFAAESHDDNSLANPGLFLNTNLFGTSVLLDACQKYGIKHFHQVSTGKVYGGLPLDKSEVSFSETAALHPFRPYAASKASADLLALSYYTTFGLPVTISRCANNYGPYQFPDKFIPLIINNGLNNKVLPIYGGGKNEREWVYVVDYCHAIDLIVRQGKVGEIYNIGGNSEKTNLQVAQAILKELGKGEEDVKYVNEQAGHNKQMVLDAAKIKNELGWVPTTSFEEGIKKTIIWYISHKLWNQRIINDEYQKYYKKLYFNKKFRF